ncbi:hypothetical protein G7Y89_g12544 [Cudoniella acicularis]|uniref:Transcription initiation factor TFIID subunit 1 histone acetyltransferase domain-containing protein n=1 Tax=Cudoniella acicularis TaxID=354080 RepID=A0A8H4RA83_9HELO|nr:hypothetical protein G7Y89_g12544 [Cudoniella acicularis]
MSPMPKFPLAPGEIDRIIDLNLAHCQKFQQHETLKQGQARDLNEVSALLTQPPLARFWIPDHLQTRPPSEYNSCQPPPPPLYSKSNLAIGRSSIPRSHKLPAIHFDIPEPPSDRCPPPPLSSWAASAHLEVAQMPIMEEAPQFTEVDWKAQEAADNDALQQLLSQTQQDGELSNLFDESRPLDTGEKADDAEDFEDISDDDLPDEEEGTGEGDVPGLTDDMGTSHDTDDLFGEGRGSSPFEFEDDDGFTQNGIPPPAPADEPEIDLRELNFPEHYNTENQDPSIPAPAESDEELLRLLWPTFKTNVTLNWNQLLPPKKAHYIPKVPEKQPKPVNPTKVSLDLAPDQEKSFRTAGPATADKRKRVQEAEAKGLVAIIEDSSEEQESEDEIDWEPPNPSEKLGGFSFTDLEILCEDWEAKINAAVPEPVEEVEDEPMDDWEREILGRPIKRRKVEVVEKDYINAPQFAAPSFDNFEAQMRKSAKRVLLDLNDPYLLVDTQEYSPAKRRRIAGPLNKAGKGGLASTLSQRFNISNDEAYDALKENHQSKVRATLGNLTVEHSMPALRMQWPYYRTKLFINEARTFHRPSLRFGRSLNTPITFSKPLLRKKKQVKGLQTHEVFKETKDLTLAEHYSSATLLEYSEEHPMILSNFGMGNRIINYYRRKDANDTERPAPEDKVGDVTPLLPEDRSPFANFGEVGPGETVRTLHNAMFRAPIFKHEPKNTDFLVIRSSTGVDGTNWHIRNIIIYLLLANNSLQLRSQVHIQESPHQTLKIGDVTAHISESSDMQNRQKLKEFFQYDKVEKVWKMKPGEQVPDEAAIRNHIKPEDVCALDAMQVGTRHLEDAGYQIKEDEKDDDDEEEGKEKEAKSLEFSLAPWQTSKAFLDASSGKAMLQLHGEGDPSGCGLAFSMIRTSMKGGYVGALQGPSATSAAAIAAERKANGGHTYNVKKQEELYQSAIREIWEKQKANLSDPLEHPENDMEREEVDEDNRFGTDNTAASGPGFDDSASQISRFSTNDKQGRLMRIIRRVENEYGHIEEVTEIVKDKRIWREYQRRRRELDASSTNVYDIKPTGNAEVDSAKAELQRLEKNKERRHAREKQKGMQHGSPQPDASGSPSATPAPSIEKPTGTTRKCANCGQAGHIKTNKNQKIVHLIMEDLAQLLPHHSHDLPLLPTTPILPSDCTLCTMNPDEKRIRSAQFLENVWRS